ncbi:MAG: hypothetical protein K0U47_11140 [Epsilonproteobacteria bacterium]|nr:hypothetical protein [Campylobacterota bacterium]
MAEKMKYVMFSESYQCKECESDLLKKTYYLGAYCKAVINASYASKVSEKNTTFKKWLSNQIINAKNLNKIFDQAGKFENKLDLGSSRLQDLSTQITSYVEDNSKKVSKYTVSYFFRKGFNEYIKFKEEQKEHDEIVKVHNKKLKESSDE